MEKIEESIHIISLDPSRWAELRELRLKALQTDPDAFAGTYEDEVAFADERWIGWLKESQEGKKSLLLFAENNNRLVGMVGALIDEVRGCATIVAMYVDMQFRKKGIAKRLIQEMCKKLEGYANLKKIELTATINNEPAIGLYESHGFVKKEYVMVKKIKTN